MGRPITPSPRNPTALTPGASRSTASRRDVAYGHPSSSSCRIPGMLEGTGDVSRVAKFLDDDDLAAKRDALQDLIRAWVAAHRP